MKKLLIVSSSVRPNRVADKVLAELHKQLKNYGEFEASVFDFRQQPLPFFDSEYSTSAPEFAPTDENVKAWTAAVQQADAVIILTAEYNHTFTAVIKNAIDWITAADWENKPVAFIGYGWVGGARAITQLRSLLTGFLQAKPLEAEANLHFSKDIDLDGSVLDAKSVGDAINSILDALK